MKKQKKPNESKEVAKISKILKDASKADEAVFELKQMAYQYCGNAVNEFMEKEPDLDGISKLYNDLLAKRAEVLEKITKLLTKNY